MKTQKPKRKPRPRCTNCGDETSYPSTSAPGREKIGWCTACFRNWQRNTRYNVDDAAFVHDTREIDRDAGVRVVADYLTAGCKPQVKS